MNQTRSQKCRREEHGCPFVRRIEVETPIDILTVLHCGKIEDGISLSVRSISYRDVKTRLSTSIPSCLFCRGSENREMPVSQKTNNLVERHLSVLYIYNNDCDHYTTQSSPCVIQAPLKLTILPCKLVLTNRIDLRNTTAPRARYGLRIWRHATKAGLLWIIGTLDDEAGLEVNFFVSASQANILNIVPYDGTTR
jgi:hypothetical protein